MKKISLVLITIMSMVTSIASRGGDNASPALLQSLHLPPTAQVAAESLDLIVFTNVDSIYDNEFDINAVTLWVYRPKSGELMKLLTTNPNNRDYECLGSRDKAQKVSLASIPTISTVYINAAEDKILVGGNDDRNCYSYIISLTEGLPTIQLPCNAGIMGIEHEEDLPIGQSYRYYKGGGRYTVISVFDWNGKCLKQLSLKNVR